MIYKEKTTDEKDAQDKQKQNLEDCPFHDRILPLMCKLSIRSSKQLYPEMLIIQSELP